VECHYNSLRLAEFQGLKSIVFPCISTGAYCFPKDIAAQSAVDAITDFCNERGSFYIDLIQIVCFDEENFKEYEKLLA